MKGQEDNVSKYSLIVDMIKSLPYTLAYWLRLLI